MGGERETARPLVVLGGGGHAAVVIDACRALGREVAGVLDPKLDAAAAVLGAPALGDEGRLEDPGFVASHDFHVGVGDVPARLALAERLARHGARSARIVHPAAVVSAEATLGEGCFVGAGAVVGPRARLAEHVLVNTAASVDHDCEVGAASHLAPGSRLCGFVRCGRGVLVGAGASVVPSRSLGAGCVVGAGAAVVRDVAAGATAVGVPARTGR